MVPCPYYLTSVYYPISKLFITWKLLKIPNSGKFSYFHGWLFPTWKLSDCQDVHVEIVTFPWPSISNMEIWKCPMLGNFHISMAPSSAGSAAAGSAGSSWRPIGIVPCRNRGLKSIDIFIYKEWHFSIDMKTKIVQHVPRTNISIWHKTCHMRHVTCDMSHVTCDIITNTHFWAKTSKQKLFSMSQEST